MIRLAFLLTVLATAAAAAAPGDLGVLLDALGERSVARRAQACRWVERTEIDDLAEDGAVKGRVFREFEVLQTPSDYRRTLRSERFEGDPAGILKKRGERAEKPAPGPFDPSERDRYRFHLVSSDGTRAVVRFEPVKPDRHRMKGTARVELGAPRILELSLDPSKSILFVDALHMTLAFGETACGWQPVRFTTEGRGGLPLMKVRFRSVTRLRDHAIPQ